MHILGSIKAKLMFVVITLIVLTATIISGVAIYTTQNKVLASAAEKLNSDLRMAQFVFEQQYPGAWEVRQGKLYKGEVLINGNYELIDEIAEETGDTITIFHNDIRVATNVKVEGKRAIGTEVSREVAEVVLEQKQTYRGKANVLGVWHQALYQPILDQQNQVVGIFYVGVPNTPYEKMLHDFEFKLSIITLVLVIVGVVITIGLATYLNRPLQLLVGAMGQGSKGDLTATITMDRNDEFGTLAQAFNAMLAGMKEIITTIDSTTSQVAAASEQLTTTSHQVADATTNIAENLENLARSSKEQQQSVVTARAVVNQVSNAVNDISIGATEQATGMSQTRASVEDMNRSLRDIADNAQEVTEHANHMVNQAQTGTQIVQKTIGSMKEIRETVQISADKIQQLGERTHQIDEIVTVIGSIAEQTNLLALNATIEAARAGEHGKGFAVVADEVRKLAERSNNSALEIRSLVEGIQQETQAAVQTMVEGSARVETGVVLVEETGAALGNISQAVMATSQQIEAISGAVEQIAANSQQLVKSADQITVIIEANTAATHEMVASSGEILNSVDAVDRLAISNVGKTEDVAAQTEELNATAHDILAAAQNLQAMSEGLSQALHQFKLK